MDFVAARRHMVESQVRPHDVTDLRIQAALETTPRELFLPQELKDQAYVEREIEYGERRRLLTARDTAKLLALAAPKPTDLVLNAVCGSGYSTALLAQLAEMIVSIESDEGLGARAEENLASLGRANAAVIVGDPWSGAEKQGPFDLIFLGGGAIEREPTVLLEQLKDGGRLAAILRKDGISRGVLYTRSGETISSVEAFDAKTQAILPGFEAPKEFVF